MHRALRIGDYWNWLPTFRVVAETSSLREAAERMHIAPSAISRTVRLLEESIGHPLFERTAGALVLNAAGHHLLNGVRAAMRLIDESHGEHQPPAACHIHCPLDLAPLLLDALESWISEQPDVPPLLHIPCAEDVVQQLLRGDLDVALGFEAPDAEGISVLPIGNVSSSVYCAPSHPAATLNELTEAQLQTLSFVEFPVGVLTFLRVAGAHSRVAAVPTMALAADLSARGLGLVCLPDFVVDDHSKLVRLTFDLPLTRLYAWFRRPISGANAPAIVTHLLMNQSFINRLQRAV
jgi:DNA-binding transcriptional LysR family regulator